MSAHKTFLSSVRLPFIGALACTLLLAGCAGSAEVHVPPNVVAAITELSELPPDIGVARTILRERCLNNAGFPVVAGRGATGASRAQEGATVGVWASEEQARLGGFPSTVRADAASPFDVFEDSLPGPQKDAFSRAQDGDGSSMEKYTTDSGLVFSRSDTGCSADSDREIFGSLRDAMGIELFVNDLTSQLREGGAADAVGEHMGAYEGCMDQAGFRVSGLHASELAGERFGRYRAWGEAPSVAEQGLAVADFRCQDSSGLAAAVREANVRAAGEWLLKNEQRILALRETLAASVVRAQNIINAHG